MMRKINIKLKIIFPILVLALFFSKASISFSADIFNRKLSGNILNANPSEVISESGKHNGRNVLWGGVIISNKESEGVSLLELSFTPVDEEGVPVYLDDTGQYFAVETNEYLDNAQYYKGRYVTVLGELNGTREIDLARRVIDAPLLSLRDIYLWDPSKFSRQRKPLNENPYANTYDKPEPERPYDAVIDPKVIR